METNFSIEKTNKVKDNIWVLYNKIVREIDKSQKNPNTLNLL